MLGRRLVDVEGQERWEACAASAPGVVSTDLTKLALEGKASAVVLPVIAMDMLAELLRKARSSVSKSSLEVYSRFTAEYGEDG